MKKRCLAGTLCFLVVMMCVPMLVAVAAATVPESSVTGTMAKVQEYIFECKSREQIETGCGGSFTESSSITAADISPVQTGEGLKLVAGTSDPTIYKSTLFGGVIPESGAVKLTFRLDSAESDLEVVFNNKGGNQRIVFRTENRSINGSAPLEVGIYYDMLLVLNDNVVSYYYKEATASSYINPGTIQVATPEDGNYCEIASLSGGTSAAGVTLYAMSIWEDVLTEEDVLGKVALKQNIAFADYQSLAALQEAKGGSANFPTADVPYTSDIGSSMTFVGSGTPAVGMSVDGIVLSAGSKKNTNAPDGTTTIGAYTWSEGDMNDNTIDTELGEVGAYKITFRLENATSKGQFVLEDGTNHVAPTISFSKDGFVVKGCDFWYGTGTEGTGVSNVMGESETCADFPLNADDWYDVILKKTNNRYNLYAKRNDAGEYKKVVSFANINADVTAKKLVLQAVLGTDTQNVSGETWYMTTSGFTVKSIGRYALAGTHHYIEEGLDTLSGIDNYTTVGSPSVADGVLNLNSGDKFIIKDLMIPVDGYADIILKSASSPKISLCDGSKALVVNTAESWLGCRIIRSAPDQYILYTKESGAGSWNMVIPAVLTADNTSTAGLYIESVGDTTAVDSIDVYGPAGTEPILITDGMTAISVPKDGTMNYKGNFRVLVNIEEDENKMGIVAGYNSRNALVQLEEFTVPTASGECSYTTTKMNDGEIVSIKVFVWDNFETMVPATPAFGANR